jgi:uncharacterized protein YciI
MARFVLQLSFKNNERRLETRPAHREYLRSLLDKGKLITAGPFADDTGAMLVYEVVDEAEVHDILADDPYTAADVYDITQLRQWNPIFP